MRTLLDLQKSSQEFAQELTDLLEATLPGAPPLKTSLAGTRYVLTPDAPKGQVPLLVNGGKVAGLRVRYFQQIDRTGKYLKTAKSFFSVVANTERKPLVRLEFDASHERAVSHWQIHAERGAFTEMLTEAQRLGRVDTAHDLSKLHLPTGGERFRPALEDFLEFLIRECGVDAMPGWQLAIENGREGWRRLQFRTAVRELPTEAAEVLRMHGWSINEPPEGLPEPWTKPYRKQ